MSADHVVLLLIAFFNFTTAVLAWRSHAVSLETQKDVRVIEKATNSMKDALIVSTGKASFAAGREEERKASDKRAIDLLDKS